VLSAYDFDQGRGKGYYRHGFQRRYRRFPVLFLTQETRAMSSKWLKLTSQDREEAIHVNLEKASTIENHKKGARIWFAAGGSDGKVDVSETAHRIFELLEERLDSVGKAGGARSVKP
jgi:hypothetical protein